MPLNDLTFEAKPAENAAVSGWSLQPEGAAAVTQDGNVFTVSDVRKDCTLVVEFRQRIPATVVFSTPEGASQPMQRSYVGEEMALTPRRASRWPMRTTMSSQAGRTLPWPTPCR